MAGLSYVSVCPIAKPLNKKRMNEMLKGCEGLGEGHKKAGGTFFQGPHNHYLCLACIAPVPVSLWGVLGVKQVLWQPGHYT